MEPNLHAHGSFRLDLTSIKTMKHSKISFVFISAFLTVFWGGFCLELRAVEVTPKQSEALFQELMKYPQFKAADDEMSAAYKKARAVRDELGQTNLRDEQRKWLKARDQAVGLASPSARPEVAVRLTRERIVQLTAITASKPLLAEKPSGPLGFEKAAKLADLGDPYALAVAAIHCSLGWETPKNLQAAVRFATLSAEKRNPIGIYVLGRFLVGGQGVRTNEKEGYRLQANALPDLMQMGADPYANDALGVILSEGTVLNRDYKKAANYFKKGALAGYAPSQFNYLMAVIEGRGVDRENCLIHHMVNDGGSDYARSNGLPNDPGEGCFCSFHLYGDSLYGDGIKKTIYPPFKNYIEARRSGVQRELHNALEKNNLKPVPRAFKGASLNVENSVWEPDNLTGVCGLWVPFMDCHVESGNVQVFFRTNYKHLPIKGIFNAEHKNFIPGYCFDYVESHALLWDYADFSSVVQHYVSRTNGVSEIKPVISLSEKNRMSAIEYPIPIEFKLVNRSNRAVRFGEIGFIVKNASVIQEFLPGIIFNRKFGVHTQPLTADNLQTGKQIENTEGELIFHNFGWHTTNSQRTARVTLFDPSKPEEVSAGLNFDLQRPLKRDVKDLFYKNPLLLKRLCNSNCGKMSIWLDHGDGLGQKQNHFRPEFFDYLPVDHTDMVESRGAFTRIPSDLTLQSSKSDYRVLFDVDAVIPAGGVATALVSFDFDKSVDATLAPLATVDGQTCTGEDIKVTYECFRQFEKALPAIPAIAQDMVSISSHQMQLGEGIEPRTKSGRNSPRSESVAVPRVQSSTRVRSYGVSHLPHVLFESTDDALNLSFSLRARIESRMLRGVLAVQDSVSGRTVYQVPFSFDKQIDAQATLETSLVRGKNGLWLAWMIRCKDKSRLYVVFPSRSDTVFVPCSYVESGDNHNNECLPVTFDATREDRLTDIGLDEYENTLVLNTRDATYSVSIGSPIAVSVHDTIFSAGFGDTNFLPPDFADCSRVRLLLPFSSAEPKLTRFAKKKKTTMSVNTRESRLEVTDLLWPTSGEVALKREGQWEIWHLQTGVISMADAVMAARYESASRSRRVNSDRLFDQIGDEKLKEIKYFTYKQAEFGKDACRVYGNGERHLLVSSRRSGSDQFAISMFNAGRNPGVNGIFFSSINLKSKSEEGFTHFRAFPLGVKCQFATFSEFFGDCVLSPDGGKALVCGRDGHSLQFVDLKLKRTTACGVRSSKSKNVFSLVFEDGFYLSGDGSADGVVLAAGLRGVDLSQFEVKYNRPDIILERLKAPVDLVRTARLLSDRLTRRSEFNRLADAELIDIPVVRISTEGQVKTAAREASVKYSASSNTSRLDRLIVYNNGALVNTVSFSSPSGERLRDAHGSIDVGLASGENLIQVCAVSEDETPSRFGALKIMCTDAPVSRASYIVCCGVSQYVNSDYNLAFAAKDARDLAESVKRSVLSRGLEPKVLLLCDNDADLSVLSKIQKFLSSATIDDEVIVFMAGHGALDNNLNSRIILYDSNFLETEKLGITFSEIENFLLGIPVLKKMLLLDTCHSGEVEKEQFKNQVGSASTSVPLQANGDSKRIKLRGLSPVAAGLATNRASLSALESMFQDSKRATGSCILASSGGLESSSEGGALKNGWFTHCLIQALKDPLVDLNNDSLITFGELAAAVKKKVSELSAGTQSPMTRGTNRVWDPIVSPVAR